MFKIIILFLITVGLVGCTQGQRFDLMKNAQLDECAMKRMSETKISGQTGYLQALSECHQIVIIKKSQSLLSTTNEITKSEPRNYFDGYKNDGCWQLVKDLVLDKYYPYLSMPEKSKKKTTLTAAEEQYEIVTLNLRKYALPDTPINLNKDNLLMVRNSMAGHVLGKESSCSSNEFHELESIVGKEIHRRYPYGVN